MPRCTQCGKVNREGALFCQDCGARIATESDVPKTRVASPSDRVAPAVPAAAPAQVSGMVTCPACGVANPTGMNFCKMCGVRLGGSGSSPVASPTPSSASPRTTCAACGGQTPANYSFCQNCGARLAPLPRTVQADAVAPTVAVPPTPPAGLRPAAAAVGGALAAAAAAGGGAMPPAATAVPGMAEAVPARPGTPISSRPAATAPRMSPGGGVPVSTGAPTAAQPAAAGLASPARGPAVGGARARLVSVRPDGTDAASCVFEGPAIDLGRTEGTMRFENDPYVAPRHARIERRDASYLLYPLDWVNGVFVRLREPTDLGDGDCFLVGRQLLRFEVPLEAERKARAAVEHGVAVFGSPLRSAWGRLRQLTVAALTLDVYYLSRAEVVLGREEGHIRFPDDEHMSRRHAALSETRGRVRLEDLASSNGTYLKLKAPRELRTGDLVRVGDQLLRFET